MSHSETKLVPPQGLTFIVETCPECGIIHLRPGVPWHGFDCSEPPMERWVAWAMTGSRDPVGSEVTMAASVRWQLSWRADPVANVVAKRHYNSQSPDSDQWVKPGACLCFRTPEGIAIWSSSAPIGEYVQHAWAGAWENSTFRNERQDLYLSSELIEEGIAATLWYWPTPPELGMVTMVDASLTRRKRDPGRCYRRAGFEHVGFTKGGLWVFQLLPDGFPEPVPPLGEQLRMVAA